MINQTIIENIKNDIIELENPNKIILFGSYARNEANENSDLDFLIIKETNISKPKRAAKLYRALAEYHIPMDLIIKTQNEIKESINNPHSLNSIMLKEGVSLYEKQIS